MRNIIPSITGGNDLSFDATFTEAAERRIPPRP
jgi:hypothetical protein